MGRLAVNRSSVVAAALVALSAAVPAFQAEAQEPPQAAEDHRSPLVAGVLSGVLPGVGSFYAGNSGHGIRHIVIWAGAGTVTMVGLAKFVALDSGSGSGVTLFLVGFSALAINDVWAIVTAVGDANAHNAEEGRRAGRVVGSLYFDPQIRILGASTGTATKTTFGLQVGRLAF
jgi:hypothetical protein